MADMWELRHLKKNTFIDEGQAATNPVIANSIQDSSLEQVSSPSLKVLMEGNIKHRSNLHATSLLR